MTKPDKAADPAHEADTPVVEAPAPRPVPTYAKAGTTPDADHLRLLDADTGREIKHVLEANTAEGWLVRREVKAGQFVRVGDDFATVRENIPTRFEWREPA
jgi:hypothetical protein